MNSEKNNDGIDYEYIEKIQKFGFKEYYSRYSTFSDRFLANLVDGIFLMLVSLPIYFLGINLITIKTNLYAYSLVMGLLPGILAHTYTIACHAKFGRTIGKKWMGLKVIDNSEEKEIGLRQALLRDCLPFLGLIFVFIYSWVNQSAIESDPLKDAYWTGRCYL